MKRNEFITLIKDFGFAEITNIDCPEHWKRYQSEGEHEGLRRKFKFGQCYILFDESDIRISFNSPAYVFHTTDITANEIQSLFYYLTIKSNRKFAIKKACPNICNIYEYFDQKSKVLDSMTNREKKRFCEDLAEYNEIKAKIK